jgi:hypothetical protein
VLKLKREQVSPALFFAMTPKRPPLEKRAARKSLK